MLGSVTVTGSAELRDNFRLILEALANPNRAQALIKELSDCIEELAKVREEATAAQREAERNVARVQDESEAIGRMKLEIERMQAEAQLKLDKTGYQLADREKNLSSREAALVANTKELNEDMNRQRAKLEADRQEVEVRAAKVKADEEALAAKVVEAEKVRVRGEVELQRLLTKASQDAVTAADLRGKFENKLSKLNAIAKSVGDV